MEVNYITKPEKSGKLVIGQDIKDDKGETEYYNLLDLHMCNLNNVKDSGIKSDLLASDYLKNKVGCTDKKIGRYNVLRLSHAPLNFERFFVFFPHSEYSLNDDNAIQ